MNELRQAVHAFERWSYATPLLSVLRDTKLGIPLVQTLHLVGITMTLGTLVVMNLRLLNLGYKALPAETFLPQIWIWFKRGAYLTICAGIVVFLPDPTRYRHNTSFQLKMVALAAALIYTVVVFRRQVYDPKPGARRTMLICAGSLLLWFAVGWCGRAIAFVG